jgi:hypothetical protein
MIDSLFQHFPLAEVYMIYTFFWDLSVLQSSVIIILIIGDGWDHIQGILNARLIANPLT